MIAYIHIMLFIYEFKDKSMIKDVAFWSIKGKICLILFNVLMIILENFGLLKIIDTYT